MEDIYLFIAITKQKNQIKHNYRFWAIIENFSLLLCPSPQTHPAHLASHVSLRAVWVVFKDIICLNQRLSVCFNETLSSFVQFGRF